MIVLAGLVVVAIVLSVVTFGFIRPTGLLPTPDPPTTSTAPAAELGPLGEQLVPMGFSCTVELPDPLIGGCYARPGDGSRSLRWQGPGDGPIALTTYVYSDASGYDFAAELESVLTSLTRSGIWTADDLVAVRNESTLKDGESADVETSWGRVTLNASRYSLNLSGTRNGESPRSVAAKTFPTSITSLESTVEDLGFTCEQSATSPDDSTTCLDAAGNYLSLSSFGSVAVETLYGNFTTDAGAPAFVTLVEAAAPADAAGLSGLVTEGAATTGVFYRAADGWTVLCTQRDNTSCSVYGVSWA